MESIRTQLTTSTRRTTGRIRARRSISTPAGYDRLGLVAKRVISRASERRLLLPTWCVDLLKARRVRRGAFDGSVFANSKDGWRDRSSVGKAFPPRAGRFGLRGSEVPHVP
jgi:hypothetical protein